MAPMKRLVALWLALLALPALGQAYPSLVQALGQPELLRRLEASAAMPVGNSPEAFRKVLVAAIENSRKVVQEAKLKFE